MKKWILSLAVAGASLVIGQTVNAETLSKEEATSLVNKSLVDMETYRKDMYDIYQIFKELYKVEKYEYDKVTIEELAEKYTKELSEVNDIINKTYEVGEKEIALYKEPGWIEVPLSGVEGNVAKIRTEHFNHEDLPNYIPYNYLAPLTENEIKEYQENARFHWMDAWDLISEHESTLKILEDSYISVENKDNEQMDVTNQDDVESLLVEQVKAIDSILEKLYYMKDVAFRATNSDNTFNMENIWNSYFLTHNGSVEDTINLANYKGVNLLKSSGLTTEPYEKDHINIDIPSLETKEIKLFNITHFYDLTHGGVLVQKQAQQIYPEQVNNIKEVKEIRAYFVDLLKEMGSTRIPNEPIQTNGVAAEQNKEQAIELTKLTLSNVENTEKQLDEIYNIGYKLYTSDNVSVEEKKELDKEFRNKIEILNYDLTMGLPNNQHNIMDTFRSGEFKFFFNEDSTENPSYIFNFNNLATCVPSLDKYASNTPSCIENQNASVSGKLEVIKEEMNIVKDYKKYVEKAYADLTGEKVKTKTESYNKQITLLKTVSLYRDADESSKTNATVSPQTVNAIEKKGEWIKIKSYLGNVYIKPDFYVEGKKEQVATKIETGKRLHLHDNPSTESVLNATLAPQQLYASYKIGDWYAVNTWLGTKFIKPDFTEEEYIGYVTTTENLKVYNSPYISDETGATLSPQTLKVLKRKGEFLLIQTWMGPKYIKLENESPGKVKVVDGWKTVKLTKRVFVHTLPGSDYKTVENLAPQSLVVRAELNNGSGWTLVSTWLGDRWVKL
ncbi:hypothetical protein U8V72_21020 [Priestia filamentosa]|uniref:hypothetical protein n=1 Tax=Priestia filamentosa TaxID=1402861 RepID=UPI00397DEA76